MARGVAWKVIASSAGLGASPPRRSASTWESCAEPFGPDVLDAEYGGSAFTVFWPFGLVQEGRATPRRSRQEWAMAADGEQRLAHGDRPTAPEQDRNSLLLDPRCARVRHLLETLLRSDR